MTALSEGRPLDPAAEAGWGSAERPRVGFFTDTSICIGCKACEVACKEWNAIPADNTGLSGMSYDNTGGLGADTWRHVAFIEQTKPLGHQQAGVARLREEVATLAPAPVDLGMPGSRPSLPSLPATGDVSGDGEGDKNEFRWLMSSDVCKHCTHAACLDVCPTGALFRTEFGTVVVQDDICNGCGYCVPACPYGVIDKRPAGGGMHKCTLCYDRLGVGLEPACAKTCPTESIQFGQLDELRVRAQARVEALHEAGVPDARLYGHDPTDGVGGDGAFFLLLDKPEVYGLPPDPVVTTRDLPTMWKLAGVAAVGLAAGVAACFGVGGRRA